MKYTGGCHCEKVRFEVELELKEVISCNCSICSKRGYLLAFAPDASFKLLSGEGSLGDYQFGKKRIHHYFCSSCGVGSFGKGATPDGQIMRAINVRCLDGVDIQKLTIVPVDGKAL